MKIKKDPDINEKTIINRRKLKARSKNVQKERPKMILLEEGRIYNSLSDMERKTIKEIAATLENGKKKKKEEN